MKILAVGDVTGRSGRLCIEQELARLRRETEADVCIVNGENAAHGNGLRRKDFELLQSYGADVVTTGNHVWGNREIVSLMEEGLPVLRPANYPPSAPGSGTAVVDLGKCRVGVINLMGRVNLEPLDCPFRTADRLIEELRQDCRVIVVDFHAEATSEKAALARYLDGRVSAVFGTHTHVQTADEQILPGGTGFLTDVGMTGAVESVIGMEIDASIDRFVNKMHHRYAEADGPARLHAVLFTVDPVTGRCVAAERLVR